MKCWRTCTPLHRPHCLEQCATMLKHRTINSEALAKQRSLTRVCFPTLKLSASGFYAQFRINVSCVASSVSSASRNTAHITPNTRDRCWLIRSANALSSPPQALSTSGLSPGMNHSSEVPQFARSYNRFSFWHKVHEFFTANISLRSSVHFRTPLYQNRTLYKTLNSDNFRNLL